MEENFRSSELPCIRDTILESSFKFYGSSLYLEIKMFIAYFILYAIIHSYLYYIFICAVLNRI